MKKEKSCEVLTRVKQLVQVDSIETANVMIASGKWVLINSYYTASFSTKKPLYTMGRIE